MCGGIGAQISSRLSVPLCNEARVTLGEQNVQHHLLLRLYQTQVLTRPTLTHVPSCDVHDPRVLNGNKQHDSLLPA